MREPGQAETCRRERGHAVGVHGVHSNLPCFDGQIVYDTSKPDGTPRKLMDVGLINATGWQASTAFDAGLAVAYAEFKANAAGEARRPVGWSGNSNILGHRP